MATDSPILASVESAMSSFLATRVVLVADLLLWATSSNSCGGAAAFDRRNSLKYEGYFFCLEPLETSSFLTFGDVGGG